MDAVIYIRVSTEEQATGGTSLETQETACREWCRRNHAGIAQVFTDAGQSAKTADRPQFLRMIDWCKDHQPDYCVVWKFDRWARNSTDHAVYASYIAKAGTRLVSATEGIEDNPAGRLLETILAGVAQYDNEVRAERVKHSMKSVAMSGGWCSVAPFGFKLARAGRLPILVDHQDKAPVVVEIFKGLAMRRRNVMQTIAYAREHGLKSSQVRNLLRSTVYAGFLRGPLTDGREIQTAFPGLISRDLFDQVQALISHRRIDNRLTQRDEFPFNRVAHCAICGKPLVSCWSKGNGGRYAYTRCRTPGHVSLRSNDVERGFVAMLVQDAQSFLPLLGGLQKHIRELTCERQTASCHVSNHALNRKARLNDQLSKLVQGWSEGLVPEDIFRDRQAEIRRKMGECDAQIFRKDTFFDDVDAACTKALRLIEDPAGLWMRMDGPARRRFVAILFAKGITVATSGAVEPAAGSGFTGILTGCNAPENGVAYLAGVLSNFLRVINSVYEAAA